MKEAVKTIFNERLEAIREARQVGVVHDFEVQEMAGRVLDAEATIVQLERVLAGMLERFGDYADTPVLEARAVLSKRVKS
jgi:hypothetical protein